MKKIDLQLLLDQLGIRRDAYCLFGENYFEAYVMEFYTDRFYVFYSERGEERSKKEFKSESEACEYMLNLLKNDKSTRI